MILSDETLMAYVDGELDTAARTAVDAALATDPEAAQRVAQHKALRLSLQRTFDEVLTEPVPQRLVNAARSAPANALEASVADLARARTAAREIPPACFAIARSPGRNGAPWPRVCLWG